MSRTPEQTWNEYLAVWNGEAPLPALDGLLAEGYCGQVGGLAQDAAALRTRIEVHRHANPQARFEVLEQFAADDRLVTRLRVSGLSGADHPLHGVNIGRHADGRLVEEWAVWETG